MFIPSIIYQLPSVNLLAVGYYMLNELSLFYSFAIFPFIIVNECGGKLYVILLPLALIAGFSIVFTVSLLKSLPSFISGPFTSETHQMHH